MTLTGQCKIDFEEWYLKQDYSKQGQYEYGQRKALNMFNAMMLPFRWGVYVDFFIEKNPGKFAKMLLQCEFNVLVKNVDLNITRIEAIEEANEIYNAQ